MATPPTSAITLSIPIAESKAKRPYVRKSDKDVFIPEFPTSPPQLSEFAFNIHGWALEDGMKHRALFEVINAYNMTMTKGGFNAKLQDMRKDSNDDVYRNNLQYTARELDNDLTERDSAVGQYLVVGYTLQEEDPIFVHNQSFSRYSENELVGETLPSDLNLIKWEDCRTPLLVVTPIKENTGTSVRLFGLVKPKSGLCQPVLLKHERIFYRWEFRASAGAKYPQRNKNWNQLVVQKAKELTPIDKLVKAEDKPTKKSLKRKRARPTIKEEVEEENSIPEAREPGDLQDNHLELVLTFENLLKPACRIDQDLGIWRNENIVISVVKVMLDPVTRAIITDIRASRTDDVLRRMRTVLKQIEMPKKLPEEDSPGLKHFGIPWCVFGNLEAQIVVDEIKAFWPELTFLVTVEKILYLKSVMDSYTLSIDTEIMEKFLPVALAYIPHELSNAEVADSGRLIELYQLSTALHQAHVAIATDRESFQRDDVICLMTLLKSVLKYEHFQKNAVRQGTVPSALVGQSFEYNFNFEINKGRRELDNTVHELFKYAKDRECGLVDINLWLERLRLMIRQA